MTTDHHHPHPAHGSAPVRISTAAFAREPRATQLRELILSAMRIQELLLGAACPADPSALHLEFAATLAQIEQQGVFAGMHSPSAEETFRNQPVRMAEYVAGQLLDFFQKYPPTNYQRARPHLEEWSGFGQPNQWLGIVNTGGRATQQPEVRAYLAQCVLLDELRVLLDARDERPPLVLLFRHREEGDTPPPGPAAPMKRPTPRRGKLPRGSRPTRRGRKPGHR